jgi:hypothetical protein
MSHVRSILAAVALVGALILPAQPAVAAPVSGTYEVVEPQPVDPVVEAELEAHLAERHARAATAAQYPGEWQVSLVPGLQAGWSGWCLITSGSLHMHARCPIDPGIDHPLSYEAWEADGGGTAGVALVESPLSTLAVDEGDLAFPAAPVAGSSSQLGVVAVQLSSAFPGYWSDEFEEVSDGIRNSGLRGLSAPPTAPSDALPANAWTSDEPVPNGPCALSARRMRGLTVLGGHVLDAASSVKGVIDVGLLSCVDLEVKLDGAPMRAALLLDASRPGRPPVVLPQADTLRRHPALRSAPGVEGPLLARRVDGVAWLAVEGGDLSQRERLLADLRTQISL